MSREELRGEISAEFLRLMAKRERLSFWLWAAWVTSDKDCIAERSAELDSVDLELKSWRRQMLAEVSG